MSSASRTKISYGRAEWIYKIEYAFGISSAHGVSSGERQIRDEWRAVLERIAERLFEKNFKCEGKGSHPVLPQVVREEYKFSLMQSDKGARLKKENGLSIAGKFLNFA